MVKINNRLDPICNLYYKGKFVGIIKNDTALLDVCAQIKQSGEEGYAVRFNKKDYPIDIHGKIHHIPEGFYDSTTQSLDIIFEI